MDFDFADRIDRYLELQDKVADLNAKTAVKTKPLSDEMSSILEELDAAMKGQNLFTAGGKKVKDGKRGVAEITEKTAVANAVTGDSIQHPNALHQGRHRPDRAVEWRNPLYPLPTGG